MSGAHRKGWCPGALRPMESGDGLIVRLKITGGEVSASLGSALAQWAEDFGNGQVDVTSRANLQLRGVSEKTLSGLQLALDSFGLLDRDAETESVRNILGSSLAGEDPQALLDIRPQIQALDERLRSDRALHGLPAKFLFLVDDGGRLPLPVAMSDIGFVATSVQGKTVFAVYLGGICAGACAVDAMTETAIRVADAFFNLKNDETRMAELVRRICVEAIAQVADLKILESTPTICAPSPHILGFHALGSQTALGLGLPFGRIEAGTLRLLTDVTTACSGVLRLSPWRAIFLLAEKIDADFVNRLRAENFILDDDAPIRAVAACSGKAACSHGETDARADAAQLAGVAQKLGTKGIALHVSACAKGCAHAEKAPVTLIGREGRYDLVLDGRAGDAPLLHGLRPADAERLLTSLIEITPEERAAFVRRQLCEAEQ
ncbi:MAG: precorrin-3B synthase [Methylovirgula sp.]|jgi:precorrin-3B synthase